MYILSFLLSTVVPIVLARPADLRFSSSSSQRPSQTLSVRSDLGTAAQSPSSSQSTSTGTATSPTTTSASAPPPPTSVTSHHHHQPTTSSTTSLTPTTTKTFPPTTSSTTSLSTISSSSSPSSSSSFSGSGTVTLIPAVGQTTLSVSPTNLQAPTTLDASNVIPDVTSDAEAPTDTSSQNESNVSTGSGLSHTSRTLIGVFTALGVVFAAGAVIFISSYLKKKKSALQFSEDDEYVVSDRSGRTGFTGVNYGNDSVTEMVERPYSDRSLYVEHTLGQEIIQQPPFDPFYNNFAFLDNQYSSEHQNGGSQQHVPLITANQMEYQHGGVQNNLQAHDEMAAQATPWANHANHATTEPGIPFRFEEHPFASDAVHVTPLRRQPSERAEYGLAC